MYGVLFFNLILCYEISESLPELFCACNPTLMAGFLVEEHFVFSKVAVKVSLQTSYSLGRIKRKKKRKLNPQFKGEFVHSL